MLPRSQKLSVLQFNMVMEKGRVTHSPLFILRSLKIESAMTLKSAKISAVAPQKIFKKAVQRTKLRRQIYEAVQPIISKINPDSQTVIFAKSAALNAEYSAIKKEINDIFVKAGLLK